MNRLSRLRVAFRALMLTLLAPPAAAAEPVMVWELTGFQNPESAVYDPARKCLYVSNINGEGTAKDNNGYISRVSPDGRMLAANWVGGMNGPKGLSVAGDRLYAADIDTLVEIDIPNAKILNRYAAPEGKFFNDVSAAADGSVYVSDSMTNRIYRLQDGKLEVWLESPQLEGPNGLRAEKDRLLVGAWGSDKEGAAHPGQLLSVSYQDRSVTSASNGKGLGNLDGIEPHPGGGYYLTDWMAGTLIEIDAAGATSVAMTLTRGLADLEVIEDTGILILPMMLEGRLAAYRVGPATK
jgi:DNA-binding beta-propeller fold protein YncE